MNAEKCLLGKGLDGGKWFDDIHGKDDQNPSPEHVARMEDELKKHNKTYLFKSYDNAGHAFLTTESPAYRQDAARSAWRKVFEFYGEYLR